MKKKKGEESEKRLSIDTIEVSRDVQPRAATDKAVVAEYAAAIEAKAKLPPVEVFTDGEKIWLAAGFHRLAAHKQAGRKQIECIVYEGDKDAAKWHALQSNQTHGLRRSNEDKVRAVKMALEHPKGKDLSSRQIADLVSVSPTMVDKYRPKDGTANGGQSRNRKGRDGRVIDTVNIGKGKKGKAKPIATPGAKASDKTVATKAGNDAEQTGRDVEDDAEVVVVGDDNDPVEVYRRMLENLPATLAQLADHADDVAGKALDRAAALKSLAHILTRILVLQDAEEKLGKKSRRARSKASDYELV